MKLIFTLLTALLLAPLAGLHAAALSQLPSGRIPFPDVLDAALVAQDRLDDIDRRALVLGNGDLSGLLWERNGVLCLRVTKNEVWDESTNTWPPPAATFENRRATLAIDTQGRIASLRCQASNRELLGRTQELVTARLKDGREIVARRVSRSGDALTFEFAGAEGTAVLAVETHPDFFTFTVRSLSVPEVDTLTFLDVPVAPAKYRASMTSMFSDDAEAVCLRGYELPVEMTLSEAPASTS
jgi:hypothetical protein